MSPLIRRAAGCAARRATWRAVAVALLLAARDEATAQPAPPSRPDAGRVVLRAYPSGDALAERHLFETLFRLLKPRALHVDEATTAADLLRHECGTAKAIHLEMFRRANPTITDGQVAAGSTVAIPPCPVWRPDATAVVSPASGELRDVVKSVVGVAGPTTMAQVSALNPNLNTAAWPRAAAAEHELELQLPYSTQTSGWATRDRGPAAAMVAAAAIAKLPGVITAESDPGAVELVRDVTPASGDALACTGPPAGSNDWPTLRQAVDDVLVRNATLFGQLARRPKEPVLVGVGDTGIEPTERRLPLHVNAAEKNGEAGEDVDGNGFDHDVFGTSLARMGGGPPWLEPDYPRADHGTGVAALAGGATASDSLAAESARRLELSILSIIKRQQVAGGPPVFSIPKEAVAATLEYVPDQHRLAVVNLSIQSRDRLDGFKAALGSTPSLVVIAAGNEGIDLDGEAVYPAFYQDNGGRVITVGAHNALTSEERALVRTRDPRAAQIKVMPDFSNRGLATVDLAAPGCQVPTLGLNNSTGVGTGTSYAAPLVAFTAALLMSEGIRSPARVRARILGSVDVVPGLRVMTSGILNIPKALTVFEDQVELRTGEIVRGRIQALDGLSMNGTTFVMKKVLKIIPLDGKNARLYVLAPDGKVRIGATVMPDAAVTILETGAAAPRTIALDMIADIVPAAPEYR